MIPGFSQHGHEVMHQLASTYFIHLIWRVYTYDDTDMGFLS